MSDHNPITLRVCIGLLFAIIYLYLRKDGNPVIWPPGYTEVFGFFFLYITGQTIFWISRYYMTHVTVNGHSGSFLKGVLNPVIIKDKNDISWVIFNLGETIDPFHLRGKLSTLIVPKSQLNMAGGNFVGKTFVKRFPFKFLPPEVKTFLSRNSEEYNLNKVYFGKYSEEFMHKNPDVIELEAEIDRLYSAVNKRNDMLEGDYDEFLSFKDFISEMGEKKRGFFDFLKRKKDQDDEPRQD